MISMRKVRGNITKYKKVHVLELRYFSKYNFSLHLVDPEKVQIGDISGKHVEENNDSARAYIDAL